MRAPNHHPILFGYPPRSFVLHDSARAAAMEQRTREKFIITRRAHLFVPFGTFHLLLMAVHLLIRHRR